MALFRQELHSLAGPYALDALDSAAEQDRYERHLNRCQTCTAEVRGFRETATRLGMAAARTPPPQLREQVMAAVARTRQLPAADDHARHARPGRRQRPVVRLGLAGGAIGVAAAVALGVVLVNAEHQLNQTRQELQSVTAVRTAADAHTIIAKASVGGTVTVVSSASRHQMVLTTSGLPPLTAGKVYQLWLIGKKHVNLIRSEGLLAVSANGGSGPVLISGALAGDTFGVTVEPPGGSIQPTVPPIVGIPLPS
jgi:anti-sigma-K factor RskA